MLDFHSLPMPERIRAAREGLIKLGFTELYSAEEVDTAVAKSGTTLVFVNSKCCQGEEVARPATSMALQLDKKPDYLVSVFAGQDFEATERARELFVGYEPSSPSIALMKDGEICGMIERSDLTSGTQQEVALKLQKLFEKFC